MNKKLFLAAVASMAMLVTTTVASAEGNRWGLDRRYDSEISAAEAFAATTHHQQQHLFKTKEKAKAVIIDVRTVEEHVGGHPPHSYSIPYPHLYNRQHSPAKGDYIPQSGEDFVAGVDALNLPKDTLIITMCRTGYRSVGAANLLADAGYTNVRNMWHGFKGKLKTDVNGDEADLDGDGVVDGSPYSRDLDGWANFQGLPVSYDLQAKRLYAPYLSLYYNVTGER